MTFLCISFSATSLAVLFPVSSWVWQVLFLLALWLVSVLYNMRCLSHNLIWLLAMPGEITLKYSICWFFFWFIRKKSPRMAYEFTVSSGFLQGECTVCFFRGHFARKRHILEFYNGLSSAFCHHDGVYDSSLSNSGLQNLAIWRFKLNLSSLT